MRISSNSNNVINIFVWLTSFHVIGEEAWGSGGGAWGTKNKTLEHRIAFSEVILTSLLRTFQIHSCTTHKNIRSNTLTYKTLQLQTENCTHRNPCFDFWTDLSLPSRTINTPTDFEHDSLSEDSVVVLGLPSLQLDISGTIYWS